MKTAWSYWKVMVVSCGRERVWASFANIADANEFCDKIRLEQPSWNARVKHPDEFKRNGRNHPAIWDGKFAAGGTFERGE